MGYHPTVADFQELYPRLPPVESVVRNLDDTDMEKPVDISPCEHSLDTHT